MTKWSRFATTSTQAPRFCRLIQLKAIVRRCMACLVWLWERHSPLCEDSLWGRFYTQNQIPLNSKRNPSNLLLHWALSRLLDLLFCCLKLLRIWLMILLLSSFWIWSPFLYRLHCRLLFKLELASGLIISRKTTFSAFLLQE